MGFRAEIRENLTLDDLRDSINKGIPVIVRLQAWKDENQTWEMNASSHYMVVIGIDSKNVYFEDPWILGNRGYIPHDEFIERWHTFSYESPTADKKNKYDSYGNLYQWRQACTKSWFHTRGLNPGTNMLEYVQN